MTAVTMHLGEIGQQLRAFRLESGMKADEIAERLGISRAALYRYEKGEVIKLDTIQRLAELLNISPLALLGVGIEYYSCPDSFFKKITQIEGEIEQILQVSDPICYQVTSPAYDAVLMETRAYHTQKGRQDVNTPSVILAQSKRRTLYSQRKPFITSMLHESRIADFLTYGVGAGFPMPEALRHKARQVAVQEIRNIITLIDSVPMGLQFSVIPKNITLTSCIFMRHCDQVSVAINPFRSDSFADNTAEVAMITSSPEAVAMHQTMLETLWQTSLKGADAIKHLKMLVEQHGAT